MIPEIGISLLFGLAGAYLLLCLFYYLFQEKMIFIPSFKNQEKLRIKVDFDEVFLEGAHGGNIHAYLLKVKNPKGCILYFHGNTGSIQRWGVIAENLTKMGYNVFIPDYRGYGKSLGVRTEALMHKDSELCMDFIKTNFPADKIILYGRSLGTGLAVRLASIVTSKMLILETPYSNLIDAAKQYAPFVPVRLLLRFQFNSMEWIKNVKCPIYIFHGTKDKVISIESAEKLFKAAEGKNNVHFIKILDGKHNNLSTFPLFRKKLRSILS